ncbi:MAG: hypothetical protein H6747_09340 [Deltaproteobacteria bacterium]|nr:hypothetical protein [Deltaproteobacteria bacterium]
MKTPLPPRSSTLGCLAAMFVTLALGCSAEPGTDGKPTADASTADDGTAIADADASTPDATAEDADASTPDATAEDADASTPDATAEDADASTPDATAEDADASTPDVTPDATAEDADASTPDATPDATAEDADASTPDATAEDADASTPDVTPDATVEDADASTPDVTPDATVEDADASTPDVTPDVTTEDTDASTPDVTAEDADASTPDATPEDADTSTPDATVEDADTSTPDATPDATPQDADATGGCKADLDCTDGIGCTIDRCVAGSCVYVKHALCAAAPVPCDAKNPCAAGVCHPTWNVCLPCGEGLGCDAGYACIAGTCAPGTGCASDKDCKDLGQVCGAGVCVDCAGDGDCSSGQACVAGSCVTPKACTSSKQCPIGVCNKDKGACAECVIDADCDAAEVCGPGGVCAPKLCAESSCSASGSYFACDPAKGFAPAESCDDGKACTDDACDKATGCTHTVNTQPCDDGDACTSGDACADGACKGGAAPNCDDGKACTDDACDKATGCTHTANTQPCDDGDACTSGDACADGACKGGAAPNCDDGKACTDDACDKATGCTHTANTQPCDDGDACTSGDACADGACKGGAAPNCDDGKACTDDACDKATGCTHTANTQPCDDGDACTSGDACASGACVGGSAKSCDDGNACTDDSCDSKTGACAHDANAASCDDGDACTSGDACKSGTCTAGAAKACDDGNPCTTDSCNPQSGTCGASNVVDGTTCGAAKTCKAGQCKSSCALASEPVFTNHVYTMKLDQQTLDGGLVMCGAPKFGEYWATTKAGGVMQRYDANFAPLSKSFATGANMLGCAGLDDGDYIGAVHADAVSFGAGEVRRFDAMKATSKWTYANPSGKSVLGVAAWGNTVAAVMLDASNKNTLVLLEAATGKVLSGPSATTVTVPFSLVDTRIYHAPLSGLGALHMVAVDTANGKQVSGLNVPLSALEPAQMVFNGTAICHVPLYATARINCFDIYGGCGSTQLTQPIAGAMLLTAQEQQQVLDWLPPILATGPLAGPYSRRCASADVGVPGNMGYQGCKFTNHFIYVRVLHKSGAVWGSHHWALVGGSGAQSQCNTIHSGGDFLFSTEPMTKYPLIDGKVPCSYYGSDLVFAEGNTSLYCNKSWYDCKASTSLLSSYQCPGDKTPEQCMALFSEPGTFGVTAMEVYGKQ